MKIIICIKQVPETGNIKIDPETHTLIRSGVPSIVNPLDLYAVEEALRWKEKLSVTTTVITMGPPQAKEALKEALSMGIDEGILLSDPQFAGADTFATSYTLSLAIKKLMPYNLILCGKQAIDGDTAQVGPGIAEHLDIPHLAYIRKIEEIDQKKGTLRAQRLMDDGYEIIEVKLPALLTVVKEINEPRLPSLKGKMRARKADLPVWKAEDLCHEDEGFFGLSASPTQVKTIFAPPSKVNVEIITGEAEEISQLLIERLKTQKIL